LTRFQVLVISAHADRRIFAEINTLAESGRAVTFVSTPIDLPAGSLHESVRVVMPEATPPRRADSTWLKGRIASAARTLLTPVRPLIMARRMRARVQLFRTLTPPAAYDVIHCHDLDTLPAAEAVRRHIVPRAKIIYDTHELFPYQEPDRAFQRYWSGVEREFIGRADRIIAPNESMCEQLVRLYGVAMPAAIYNSYGSDTNTAPLSRADFERITGVPPNTFCILFQGALHPLRNLPNLTRAFTHLDDSYRLVIIGSGPMEQTVRELCDRHSLRHVHLVGFIPQADLLRYTAHADLGVIPYEDPGLLNMRYCTPNKLFEFIEAQVPICASDLPELSRIVVGNGIGAVYPMTSPQAIAAALRDGRARCEHGEFTVAARETARRKFAWAEQGQRLLELYEHLGV
jgi:glycosyltransferase involved in cell wall biosynthesis